MSDESAKRARAAEIIAADPFIGRLGIRFDEIGEGTARVSVEVADWMVNFHGTTHGGLLFTLADAALSAASNSRGQISFALDMSITYMRGTRPGTRLVAEAREVHLGGPAGFYELDVREEPSGEIVARSHATAYRKRDSFV